MIVSFQDEETRQLFIHGVSRRFGQVARSAARKLRVLHDARRLEDLRFPPGNRLEALRGERAGQYSIRVNDQYRICFRWSDEEAHDVECVDYH